VTDPADDADRELRDAREQSAASREILAALGRDVANPGTVLDTVLEFAARLCGARAAQLFLLDGDVFRLERVAGETPEDYHRHLMEQPIARDRSSTVGRAAADKCTVQIPDVEADADYGRRDLQRATGFRTLLSTPMLLQDEVVGVLSMWRTDVAPFDDRECALLEEFAVEAAIVLRQVNLMRALESHGTELASKVAHLEALQEVDEAVGSSLDLDEVLERVVSNAVRLTNLGFGDITLRTDGGSILEYHEVSDSFHVHAFGSSHDLLEQLRAITIGRESTLIGRTAGSHRPFEIPDLAEAVRDPYLDILFQDGWRSVLAVPIVRGEKMLGVLAIRRRGTGNFPPDVTELLQTFASQSAVAIVNARLFGEVESKSTELANWNTELESRVAQQVAELDRANRLRRFLSPQLADLVIGDETLLESHRREIVVVFTDLRNFTPFAEASEPEEVMGVLAEYHRVIGARVHEYGGTLERFTGDGVMVFFNDPIQCDDPAERAVRMSIDIRDAVRELAERWRRNGHDLGLGIGIAQNFATLGRIGFEGRFDYAAIGSVTNLAARLCGDARAWQVLVTDRVLAPIEQIAVSEFVGDVQPKGFSRPVRVHNISAIHDR
jgi:class 3 adenylate cyclase/putative methionine-R-sulfoxide reductase with GAF domain